MLPIALYQRYQVPLPVVQDQYPLLPYVPTLGPVHATRTSGVEVPPTVNIACVEDDNELKVLALDAELADETELLMLLLDADELELSVLEDALDWLLSDAPDWLLELETELAVDDVLSVEAVLTLDGLDSDDADWLDTLDGVDSDDGDWLDTLDGLDSDDSD